MNAAENQIAKLTVQAKLDFLPGTTTFIREVISKLGIGDKDARRMELVVEEACVNVIEHAFEDEGGTYDIAILRRPGQIVIGVEDRGLPFDILKIEGDKESGLGMILMRAFADEVHFMNLGRQGKRVELVKNLPDQDLAEFRHEKLSKDIINVAESDIKVRLMRPDETVSLARCAYRCYGYTYATDNFYFPDRVNEMVKGGIMISVVAVNSQGEIVGHVAVVKETPEALIGESGQAIVDPRYRGQGFHKQMGFLLQQTNKEAGMLGTYGEAVTIHPYSQKSAFARGYVEMGILLGYIPATMDFKKIQGEVTRKRRPVLLLYKRLNEEPLREVYLPAHHAGIMRRIYEKSQLRRKIVSGASFVLPENSRLDVKVQAEINWAFLRVVEYGRDLVELVKFRLKELCLRKLDCIYLEMPLSHPAVQQYCASMEMLGFFFGGIMPEMQDGDVLRMQFFNNADLELEDVHLASAMAEELYDYVLKASGLTPSGPGGLSRNQKK
ncbi:MAG: ATP-binding protein [Dehalococcoidales bacterium]|nr:ATP-binding protein [Dehalococcoidales bacterium]